MIFKNDKNKKDKGVLFFGYNISTIF